MLQNTDVLLSVHILLAFKLFGKKGTRLDLYGIKGAKIIKGGHF